MYASKYIEVNGLVDGWMEELMDGCTYGHKQGSDFDDMSSFFTCEIDEAIQYINILYGAQAPKIIIL